MVTHPDFPIGTRVALPAWSDLFARGARYGAGSGYRRVRLGNGVDVTTVCVVPDLLPTRTVRFQPEDLLPVARGSVPC